MYIESASALLLSLGQTGMNGTSSVTAGAVETYSTPGVQSLAVNTGNGVVQMRKGSSTVEILGWDFVIVMDLLIH